MIDFIAMLHDYSSDAGLIILSAGVYILWCLKESMEKLNMSIAVIIERVDNHEKRLDRLEDK